MLQAEGVAMMSRMLRVLARRGRNLLITPIVQNRLVVQHANATSQIQLQLTYSALRDTGHVLPGIDRIGFKMFSQSDEDGILLYIFSIIGVTNKQCVEICAGNGIECNTANLIINHGWHGLLVDGNASYVKTGIRFYEKNANTYVFPPTFVHSWITRDNVNEVIRNHGFKGEIDLLSIDLDGVDYWIWKSIIAIEPRVVVVEYQDIIGPDKAITVPYDDNFDAYKFPTTRNMPNFCGASLAAFVKLANTKGYRLVGCNRYGFNAFFIKKPIRREIYTANRH
jgi:hypothetical protein